MIPRSRFIPFAACQLFISGLFWTLPILFAHIPLSFQEGGISVWLIISLGSAAGAAAGMITRFLSRTLGFMHTSALVSAVCGVAFCGAAFSWHSIVAGICCISAMLGYGIFQQATSFSFTLHTQQGLFTKIPSFFTAAGDIGGIVLASLTGFAVVQDIYGGFSGWRVISFAYGVLMLCAALWLFFSCRGESPQNQETLSEKRRLSIFSVLKSREPFLALSAGVLSMFSSTCIFTLLPMFLLFSFSYIGLKVLGFSILGFTTGAVFGKRAGRILAENFDSKKTFIAVQILLMTLLCLWLVTDSLIGTPIVAFLLGIVAMCAAPALQGMLTESVRGAAVHDGDILSINCFLHGMTSTLSPLVFGIIFCLIAYARRGNGAMGMNGIYALMAVMAVMAIIPVLCMKKERPSA